MILLSKPTPMKKVNVICPKEYSDRVVALLHEIGAVHIAQSEPAKIIAEYEAYVKLREEIVSLISRVKGIKIEAELTAFEAVSLTVDKVKSDVLSLAAKVSRIESELSKLKEERERLTLFNIVLSKIPFEIYPRTLYYQGKRISSLLLICKRDALEVFRKSPYIVTYSEYSVDEEFNAVLVYLESSKFAEFIELAKSHNVQFPLGSIQDYIERSKSLNELKLLIQSDLSRIESSITQLEAELERLLKDHALLLGKYLLYIDNMLRKYGALSTFRNLKHLSSITGWIPATLVNDLTSKLNNSNVPVYVDLKDPDPDDNPPTLMKNKPVIRFFQLVTRLYGIPGYWEWDPTPLIAYSFALFFGLMNADLGYAFIGILATLYVLDRFVEDPRSPIYREFKGIVLASNTIALILGILSGSVFGDLLQRFFNLNLPVLLTSILSPLDFIKLSLIIGLIHVNLAHTLTTIKLAKEKKSGDFLVETGLFTLEVFGIPYILSTIFKYRVPLLGELPLSITLSGIILGVFLIIIGSLISMRWLGVLMWLFQITGLLGDVLSYVRLAGVGLATYYMALIFNVISEFVINNLIQIHYILCLFVSLPLIIVAHFMVLILAQLGAFVHSLRLCILEFLSKFYEGNGYEYNPFRVVGRIVITPK